MATPKKLYPAELHRRRQVLMAALAVLACAVIFLQTRIDPGRKEYHDKENVANTVESVKGLNNEFLLLPLLGFREAAAGLLWVRCDEFFHSGDYDAILPLVRLITWLDPHADNVYVTGAWHLSYNFTDANERSDRRYIPPAMGLLNEGIANNQNIFDIKFEKGWQSYDKIKDYDAAEHAFADAIAGPDKNGMFHGAKDADNEGFYPYAAPLKVMHMLAHTYERRGRVPEAIQAWDAALARSNKLLSEKPNDYSSKSMRDAELHNRSQALQRYYDRYTATNHDHNNPTKFPAIYAGSAVATGKQEPFDVAFKPYIRVKRPRVFEIGGRVNLTDGGRIEVRITDWNYKDKPLDSTLRALAPPDLSQTILIDSIAIKKASFMREMDMSRDPKMYSFSDPENLYKIVLTYNPRTTAPHLQDFTGWSGEGITDANKDHVFVERSEFNKATKFVDGQDGEGPNWDGKTIPFGQFNQPLRVIRVTYKITREQILGNKPITDKDIVPNDNATTIQLR